MSEPIYELPATPANNRQQGGDHYRQMKIQPWDFIIANQIPFMEGSIITYIVRWRQKGGILDLRKAKHFIEKMIEVAEAEAKEKA